MDPQRAWQRVKKLQPPAAPDVLRSRRPCSASRVANAQRLVGMRCWAMCVGRVPTARRELAASESFCGATAECRLRLLHLVCTVTVFS